MPRAVNAIVIDARLATQRTARLTLRVPEERDLDAWAGWLGDDDTVRFLGGTTSTRAQSWRTLAMVIGHWHLRGYGSWTACDVNDDDVVVGRGGLWRPEGWPDLEVGWLVGREHRRRGYAKEIGAAGLRAAFTLLQAPRVISIVHVDNHASHAVAASLGMRIDRHETIMGSPCAIWQIDVDTWRSLP